MKNIPFFNYPALFEQRKGEYLNIVQDVLSRGTYIMQQDLIDFENDHNCIVNEIFLKKNNYLFFKIKPLNTKDPYEPRTMDQ